MNATATTPTPPLPRSGKPAETTKAGAEAPGRPQRRPRDPRPPEVVNTEAREMYRLSLAEEQPLTGRGLGEMYGRGETWGLDRIREVQRTSQLAAEVADRTAPRGPHPVTATRPRPVLAAGAVARPRHRPTPRPTALESTTPHDGHVKTAVETTAVEQPTKKEQVKKKSQGKKGEKKAAAGKPKPLAVWPVLCMLLPASVAIWSGWVGLGEYAGFGPVRLLPGIADNFVINSAITLPIGMEAYSAYALYVWLSGRASERARKFARTSAIISLAVGSLGQVTYHVMAALELPAAPVWIVAGVACLPVAVVGLGAALAHMVRAGKKTSAAKSAAV